MPVNIFVSNPKGIKKLSEIEDIIKRVEKYQKEIKTPAGVVLVQNMQLGIYYIITSEEDANEGMKKEKVGEWYVQYWPYNKLQELRKNFKAA